MHHALVGREVLGDHVHAVWGQRVYGRLAHLLHPRLLLKCISQLLSVELPARLATRIGTRVVDVRIPELQDTEHGHLHRLTVDVRAEDGRHEN